MAIMTTEDKRNAVFLTIVHEIVKKHKCHIESIDLERRIIDIACPEQNEQSCALEMSEKLGRFLV
jgi:c-di-GMP-binding flagellar brake protein YcgR